MQELGLLILAAGIGSRYGGDKQIDTFGPDGAWLMEYALFDAASAGFSKAVVVIREEMRSQMAAHLLPRWQRYLPLSFVPQTQPHPLRKKPWGTAHATLCAAEALQGGFALINADDFYGRSAFVALSSFLRQQRASESRWAMVGYRLKDTLSEAGSVSRGVCQVGPNGQLQKIVEETEIVGTANGPRAAGRLLPSDSLVSMNCWAFTTALFAQLRRRWSDFYITHQNDAKAECYLPAVVGELIEEGAATVQVLPEGRQWLGVTYPQEKTTIQQKLKELHTKRHYPEQVRGNNLP